MFNFKSVTLSPQKKCHIIVYENLIVMHCQCVTLF